MRSSGKVLTVALLVAISACSSNNDNTTTTTPTPTSSVQPVARTDIASDTAGGASTDPTLVNAWGLAFNPAGFAWVSSNETGLSEVYDSSGGHVIPSVHMPGCGADASSSPTGQVFNGTPDAFMGDSFIFVTEQGTIAGWQKSLGENAQLRVDAGACAITRSATTTTPQAASPPMVNALYKGATIANDATGRPRLYVANFRAGTVDVFDAQYARFAAPGGFTDNGIPPGFAPFNVQAINDSLIVTYAKQDDDKEDDVAGAGNGYVDLFDVDGTMMARLISAGELNSPWGVAMTPQSFGQIPNHLLIGNFGDGLVHVYALDPTAGIAKVQHESILADANNNPMVIDGLWALTFGVDAGGFQSNTLYFTAGPAGEAHGVFGRLTPQTVTTPAAPAPTPAPIY